MVTDTRPHCALTIAGSDSGGGAGIQGDLKAFAALGVHGLSVLTALTAQNTRGVSAVHVPPIDFLRAQLAACFDDFRIGAIKIGMLATAEVVDAVAEALDRPGAPPIVLDPVMIATSGASLLTEDAITALRERLLPMATLVTPNIPEAEALLGQTIEDGKAAEEALLLLRHLGARAVLLKGGHLLEGAQVVDRYDDGQTRTRFAHGRIDTQAHGTGCTLAAAVTANLCRGMDLQTACRRASDYVAAALLHGYRAGRGDILLLKHVDY